MTSQTYRPGNDQIFQENGQAARADEQAASLRNRQQSLRSGWQGDEAGTEEMRMALQHYRAFWHRLEDYPTE
jgi:hypothetical protein